MCVCVRVCVCVLWSAREGRVVSLSHTYPFSGFTPRAAVRE